MFLALVRWYCLSVIDDSEEQETFANYLYLNCVLPISGAKCLNRILNQFAYAKKPLPRRIPRLQVSDIVFLYGSDDWMDVNAALDVFRECRNFQNQATASPGVKVFQVPNAGHLLMLDNWNGFNAAFVSAAIDDDGMPVLSNDGVWPIELTLTL